MSSIVFLQAFEWNYWVGWLGCALVVDSTSSIMRVHLYGSRGAARSSAGQGVDKASDHSRPSSCSKLIQCVPERMKTKSEN